MKSTPKIICNKCGGKGEINMSEELVVTLGATAKMKRITALDVSNKLHWTGDITAINKRLNELAEIGFFTIKRVGKTNVYTPTK